MRQRLFLALLLTTITSTTAMAQTTAFQNPGKSVDQSTQANSLKAGGSNTLFGSVSENRLRFAALGELLELRLEVIASTGDAVFDSGFKAGNVLDWQAADGKGQPLAEATYLCLVTVKDAAGRLTKHRALMIAHDQTVNLQPSDNSRLAPAQAEVAGESTDEAVSVTLVEGSETSATAILAHDGRAAQLVSGGGGLTISNGNFFAGKIMEQVRLTAEGNLGIGLASPQVRLDVNGFVRASQGIVFPDGSVQFSAAIKTHGTASLGAGQFMPGRTGGQEHQEFSPTISGTGTTGKISKWIDGPSGILGDANLTEVTGAIGINGTPDTRFRLDVNGSVRFRGSNPGFNLEGLRPQGNVWAFQTVDDDGRFRLFSQDNVNPGQERLTIGLSTGNVGLGISSPTTKLQVAGDVRSSVGSAGSGGRFSALNPNNQSALAHFDWVNDGSKDWPRIRYGGTGEGAINGFLIQGPSDVTKLAILNSGSVGIGTMTPSAKLDVVGNINSSMHYDLGGLSVLSNGGSNNLFVGVGVGASNSGGSNTFVGFNAGNANTSGTNNAFFGAFAGLDNDTGVFNSFFGASAGRFNGGGNNNSFFGQNSGINNSTGSFNSFFGQSAGQANTTGIQNSYFGRSSGIGAVGSNNAFFGASAGSSAFNIDNSSFLGAIAQGADGIANATAIGFRAKVTQSHSLVLGSINGTNGCTPAINCDSVKVGIGTTSPQERLDVVGKSLFSDDVGIGTSNAQSRLHVADSVISVGATLSGHVATIQNTSTDTDTPVLALQVASSRTSNSHARYITFFRGDSRAGDISGDDNAGIAFQSNSADYAEWLPRLSPNEKILAGEIVGQYGGRITKRTQGASRVMVVSTGPIVLGNDPGEKARPEYERVAFLGQVPVRVRGAVRAGDFIIASGGDDGTGVAVSPACITPEQFEQVVGQAWESSSNAGVKPVRTAVGLIQRDPTVKRLLDSNRQQSAEIAALAARLTAIESRLNKKTAAHQSVAKR
jgi:hypothetical protein